MTGTGVPEGFTLPWNLTVSLADVWAAEFAAAERIRLERRRETQRRYRAKMAGVRVDAAKAAKADVRRRLHSDYKRHSNVPAITPAGKIAYAGYEGDEA